MIAILLATYNGEKYIKEQIDSILVQMDDAGSECCLYIHDDGSKDSTPEIIERYCLNHPDQIKLLEGKATGGSTKNFMYMLDSVGADYYMFSDQDDVWYPHKIRKQYDEMLKSENKYSSYSEGSHISEIYTLERDHASEYSGEVPLLVFSDMDVVDESLNIISDSFFKYSNLNPYRTMLHEIVFENVVSGCCMFFNRCLRDMALKYSDVNAIKWHDWWITEIATSCGYISYIPEKLMMYRQHGDNSVGAIRDVSFKRVVDKLKLIFSGEQSRVTRQFIKEAVQQVNQLANLQGYLHDEAESLVRMMITFDCYSKSEKIKKLREFNITRDKRNLWMLLHI